MGKVLIILLVSNAAFAGKACGSRHNQLRDLKLLLVKSQNDSAIKLGSKK